MPEPEYKRCFSCGESKSLEDFHLRRNSRDGHDRECKVCVRARGRAWRAANRERKAENDRRYAEQNPESAAAKKKLYAARHPQRRVASVKRDHEQNPEKYRARWTVQNALQRGHLVKPVHCEDCGDKFEKRQLHGHHDDYGKPLAVAWLCPACHKQRHSAL